MDATLMRAQTTVLINFAHAPIDFLITLVPTALLGVASVAIMFMLIKIFKLLLFGVPGHFAGYKGPGYNSVGPRIWNYKDKKFVKFDIKSQPGYAEFKKRDDMNIANFKANGHI